VNLQGRPVQDQKPGDVSLDRSHGVRIAVIGGGFGGIASAYYLKKAQLDNFLVFESSSDPGGTWNDNRYPGAEVDVVSHLYCFTFNMNDWSQRYGSQKEVKGYLGKTVDEFGLRSHFRFNTMVASAVWSDRDKRYTITFADGRTAEFEAVISSVGFLNVPLIPPNIDMAAFPGIACHSSRWRDDISLEGKRVGIIGTGSSAVQIVGEAAKVARSVTIFQRSPSWVMPKKNRAFTAEQRTRYRNRWQYRFKYLKEFLKYERVKFGRLEQPGSKANQRLYAIADRYLKRSLEGRPDLVAKLTPDHPYGAKRPVASDAYFTAMRQHNVSVAPAVACLNMHGLTDVSGNRHDLDVVVLATGFHAADYLSQLRVIGRDGANLHDTWKGEPAAFLGSCIPGFPNFFMTYGPNSNTSPLVFMLECQASFAAGCIAAMAHKGASTVEVKQSAFDDFNSWIQQRLETSVYKTTRNYYSSPSGRIVTQWPFSVTRFWWISWRARRTAMTVS
jgi:cation diffusion facilitator CzcD-associated flavoprotein CzcO